MSRIREPAVAGFFYPADARELRATVLRLLEAAAPYDGPAPKALIAPHAGYTYSGPVAASGYRAIQPCCERYRRVVLMGPCHRVPVRGLAASAAETFRTPLGNVPVDTEAIARLEIPVSERAHRDEHSLEVHLPFLQTVLAEFELLPIVVGDMAKADVAAVLDALWGGPETLVVISSDLSHYLDYASAVARDAETSAAIEGFEAGRIGHEDACGATPVGGLLIEARRKGFGVARLDVRNSGDTAGGKDRVVGYGCWTFDDRAIRA